GASSNESVFGNATTPDRKTLLRTRFGIGTLTPEVITVMIRPPPWAFIEGTAPRISQTALIRFWRKACSHSASLSASADPGGGPPAFATRMLILLKWVAAAPRSATTPSGRDTSAGT